MHGTFSDSTHVQIDPAILYFGTPVVLIGFVERGQVLQSRADVVGMWVGWRCMLGLSRASKTTENMIRTGECVLNLPSSDLVNAVDRLARTTGSDPFPAKR